MKKSNYNHVSPLAPGKFVGNLVGGLTGAASGFLKAREAAKESGDKMTFRGAIGDVLTGGVKGAMDPTGISGVKNLLQQGAQTIGADAARNEVEQGANAEAMIAESQGIQPPVDPTMTGVDTQNSSVNPFPVFGGNAQQTMGSLFA